MVHANQVTLRTPLATARSPLALFFDLFKLRIGLVIAFTAVTGIVITPGPALPLWRAVALALAVTLASAAAGAFNQFMERDIDAQMSRTQHRAFVTGRLTHGGAWLAIIIAIAFAGVVLAAVAVNVIAALFTFLGALTYGVIYTVWLKRRTPWNIVIGGLAGSFAVLAGATAVNPNMLGPVPLALALVLFLWTPPHFWSLAIAYRKDYVTAGVPMLPVVIGEARAARIVLVCTLLLVGATLLPALLGLGPVYLLGALAGGVYFLYTSVQLARVPNRRNAMINFHASLLQLTLLLVAALVDTAVYA